HRPASGCSLDDLVALRDLVVDRVVEIRECGPERGDEHLEPLVPSGNTRGRRMIDDVRTRKLIDRGDVSAVDHFLEKSPCARLVFLGAHGTPPFPTGSDRNRSTPDARIAQQGYPHGLG